MDLSYATTPVSGDREPGRPPSVDRRTEAKWVCYRWLEDLALSHLLHSELFVSSRASPANFLHSRAALRTMSYFREDPKTGRLEVTAVPGIRHLRGGSHALASQQQKSSRLDADTVSVLCSRMGHQACYRALGNTALRDICPSSPKVSRLGGSYTPFPALHTTLTSSSLHSPRTVILARPR